MMDYEAVGRMKRVVFCFFGCHEQWEHLKVPTRIKWLVRGSARCLLCERMFWHTKKDTRRRTENTQKTLAACEEKP